MSDALTWFETISMPLVSASRRCAASTLVRPR